MMRNTTPTAANRLEKLVGGRRVDRIMPKRTGREREREEEDKCHSADGNSNGDQKIDMQEAGSSNDKGTVAGTTEMN